MGRSGCALLFGAASSLFLLAGMVNAQTTYIEQGANGSWNTTTLWSPAGPPDGIDNTIGSINPGGGRTITLDGNHTIGNIAFTINASRSYTINAGTPSTSVLTLQVSSGTPSVGVAAGATAGTLTIGAPVAGTQGLSKTGVGIFVLGGVNTFTGTASVSQGWLDINGSLATGAPVLVSSGGNLAGKGTINDGVTLNSGGNINPGDVFNNPIAPQVGTLTAGSLTWNGGGKMAFQLGDPSLAANSDQFILGGALTEGTAGTFSFTFTQLTGFSTSGTYTLMTFGSDSGFSASDFSGAPTGMEFDLTSTSLLLDPIPVPEPSMAALLAIGGLMAVRQIRRRKV